MIKYFALIFGAVAILATPDLSEYKFSTVLRSGAYIKWNTTNEQPGATYRRIADGRCSGGLDYQDDYACVDSQGVKSPPPILQVEVFDNVGFAKVGFSANLTAASIYRAACTGVALIEIRRLCPEDIPK